MQKKKTLALKVILGQGTGWDEEVDLFQQCPVIQKNKFFIVRCKPDQDQYHLKIMEKKEENDLDKNYFISKYLNYLIIAIIKIVEALMVLLVLNALKSKVFGKN